MATTKTTKAPIKKTVAQAATKTEDTAVVEKDINAQNEELIAQIAELKMQLENQKQKSSESNSANISYVQSQMDRPCTLIHLVERHKDLGTTITVNGKEYYFENFGERRTLRYEAMEQVISKYRDYFHRGIFSLGDDCADMQEQLGISVDKYPMSVQQFNQMENLPNDEFERLIKEMNEVQRIHIAHTWMKRNSENTSTYNNLEKMKILNENTGGFMKDFISQIVIK